MRLRDARPEDLLRCGVVFGQVAEQVHDGISQARISASVRWTGRPNQRYQAQLEELCGRMRAVEASHDAACDALVSYSRALEPARDFALQADLIEAQAEDLARLRVLIPGTTVSSPVTAEEFQLRTKALLLREEAVAREHSASTRCAAQLRDLAGDAPRIWSFQLNRFTSEAGTSFGQTFTGTAILAQDAFLSVPGVGDRASREAARRALWGQAQAMARPWSMVEEVLDQLRSGHAGVIGGQLAAALVLRGAGPPSSKMRLFGSHDQMHPAVLGALRVRAGAEVRDLTRVNGWILAREQRRFLVELKRLQKLPAPSVRELIDGDLDLVQQEALGGHTLYKHVGRDVDFLRKRQLAETRPGGVSVRASSFLDEAEATSLIKRAMADADNADAMVRFADSPRTVLQISARADGHGVMVDPAGVPTSPRYAVIEFKKNADGSVFLHRAFLDDRPLKEGQRA